MPEDEAPFDHPANDLPFEPKAYPDVGGLEKQVAIKVAARRLLALAPEEPEIVLYCRGFRVIIERGEFKPPEW